MANDLEKKIISQVEYYFGDINLPRDKFLQEKIKEDEGWVTLEVLLSFKRLANLSTDHAVITDAVEKSEKKLVLVSEDRKKLRRSPDVPLPEFNDERKKELASRTAYAKGFPTTEELDPIEEFLKPHGPISSCQRRTYFDKLNKETKFKGSCFVIFEDVETCKKFIEAESVKYKDTELIRKWQAAYFEEKKKESESRTRRKNKNKGDTETKEDEGPTLSYPPGAIVYFSGIKGDQTVSREDIKGKIEKVTKAEISFIDYSKGLTEGYIRFQEENAGGEFFEKLEEAKLKIGDDVELTFKVLGKDEEESYVKKVSAQMKDRKNKKKNGGKFNNRKRRGNFSHHDGPRAKK